MDICETNTGNSFAMQSLLVQKSFITVLLERKYEKGIISGKKLILDQVLLYIIVKSI
jgi:hypothetical protein